MACVYLTWISLTKASRLILPAPPISAASASRRKWRVVSTSSSTSLHLWYNQCFVVYLIQIQSYKIHKKNLKANISIHWLFEFRKPVRQVNSLLISFYKFSYTKISRNLVFFFWSTFFESKYSTSILVLKLFEVKHKLPLHEAIQKVKAGSISWGPGTVCPQFIISEGVTAWVTIPMSQTIPGGVCMGSIHLGQKQTALWPWGSEKGKTQINSL